MSPNVVFTDGDHGKVFCFYFLTIIPPPTPDQFFLFEEIVPPSLFWVVSHFFCGQSTGLS